MSSTLMIVLTIFLVIPATVAVMIFITPEKKRKSLPPFLQIVHDIFNFKFLILEKIMKALYIFSTIYVLTSGLVSTLKSFSILTEAALYYDPFPSFLSAFFGSLLGTILAPVLVRIAYEFIMMVILGINNIISINKKLKDQNAEEPIEAEVIEEEIPAEPVIEEKWVFCVHCGTRYNENASDCPNCGKNNRL